MRYGLGGTTYHPGRGLWVILAHEDGRGGIGLFASRDITDVEIEIRNDPWTDFEVGPGGVYPERLVSYNQMRPRITIDAREFTQIRGPHLRALLEGLYASWKPTPEGDVSHH